MRVGRTLYSREEAAPKSSSSSYGTDFRERTVLRKRHKIGSTNTKAAILLERSSRGKKKKTPPPLDMPSAAAG